MKEVFDEFRPRGAEATPRLGGIASTPEGDCAVAIESRGQVELIAIGIGIGYDVTRNHAA